MRRHVKSCGCSRAAGGTGRRARLRGVWGNPSGFESRVAHQLKRPERLSACFPPITAQNSVVFARTQALVFTGSVAAPPRDRTFACVDRRPIIPAGLTSGLFTLEEARRAGLSPRQLEGRSWQRVER